MPGATRKTTDTAGGTVTSGSPDVLWNGQPAARHGDTVAAHGIGAHGSATLIAAAPNTLVNGLQAVKAGDAATCGHTTTGSSNVLIGG